jgi:hypothetical protein
MAPELLKNWRRTYLPATAYFTHTIIRRDPMLKRIEGAVMIINALLPLIVVLVAALIGWAFVYTVKSAAAEPLARMQASVERMDKTIDAAKQAAGVLTYGVIEGVAKPIRATTEQIEKIPASIKIAMPDINIPDARLPLKPHVEVKPKAGLPPVDVRVWMTDLNVGMPKIKGFTIPETQIPGLADVKQVLTDVFGIFGRFVDVLTKIASLGTLGEDVTVVLVATRDLIDNIAQATATLVTVIIVLFWVGIAWFLLSYVMWAQRRLRIGWALVRGL